MENELNSLGSELPPIVPPAPEEQESSDGGIPVTERVAKVEYAVSTHDKDIFTLKAIQIGILVVVGIGFVAIIVSIFIFFIETMSRYEAELSARADKNSEFEIRNIQIEDDSLRARLGRLELRQYNHHSVQFLHKQDDDMQDEEP